MVKTRISGVIVNLIHEQYASLLGKIEWSRIPELTCSDPETRDRESGLGLEPLLVTLKVMESK